MFKYRLSYETWQLLNILKCLLPELVKLFDTKENIICKFYYSKIHPKIKIYYSKRFFNRTKLKKVFKAYPVFGRLHSKLFINCHVPWNTWYLIYLPLISLNHTKVLHIILAYLPFNLIYHFLNLSTCLLTSFIIF